MDKRAEILFKLFEKSLSGEIDFYGVTVLPSGKYTDVSILDDKYKVPLLKIKNPNNIPFSYNSLHDLIHTMYIESSLIKAVGLPNNHILQRAIDDFIKFDDFNTHDFHIPDEIYKKLLNCLNTDFVETKYRDATNTIYTIKYKYFINNDFNMYWESDEEFRIDIAIKVDSLWVEKLEEDEYYFETDEDEIESAVYEIYGDEPYLFEQPIWGCISDYLSDYTTFLNTEWQFVSVNIYVS